MKNHHSLVLRAESASDKYMWLARLKNASDGASGGKTPVRGYTSDQLRADSVTSSSGALPTPREGRPPRQGGVRLVCALSFFLSFPPLPPSACPFTYFPDRLLWG